MDSDLNDSIVQLRRVFEARRLPLTLSEVPVAEVDALRKQLRLPPRYRSFLRECNPIALESVTPVERIRFFPLSEVYTEQERFRAPDGTIDPSWKSSWIVVGESTLLGDPYFLDVDKEDAEGDCPVYTAMSGEGRWVPTLAGSSLAQFFAIVAAAMDLARGYAEGIIDVDDEASFRENLAPRVRVIDNAAAKAGHWT